MRRKPQMSSNYLEVAAVSMAFMIVLATVPLLRVIKFISSLSKLNPTILVVHIISLNRSSQ